ncbi:PAS domain S-box protein [Methylobacterium sp. Leaf86]|uniref:PAS domain-containing sensor histidine kinase n=1 Tax=Methylobacterium sp. Leaf86 TaxID=1736242 RepID=UPI0009EC7A40|nr:PAS domain S-box protein [Methylobacterium sp. Leaf86]
MRLAATNRGSQVQRVPAQLLDVASESLISSSPDGEITSWNLAAAMLYGWQPHEALGRKVADLIGGYSEKAKDAVGVAGVWEGKQERRRRDGSTCTVRLRLARSTELEPPEWMEVSSVLDTEHPAERALAASEYRYRNLFGAVAASFWELDFSGVGLILSELAENGVTDFAAHLRAYPEISREMMRATRIVDTNDRSLEMFGPGSKRELIATPLDYYWPDDSTSDFTESVISAITKRPRHVAETRMRALDGREFEAVFTVSFLPGTVGGGTLLVGFTDISDRVQAARLLGDVTTRRQMLMDVPTIALSELAAPEVAQAFSRLRSEGIPDLRQYIYRNPDFIDFVIEHLRLTSVNEAVVRLFGARSAEELIGRSMTGIIPPGSEAMRRSIESSYLREPVFQSEMRIFRLDGTPVDTLFCRVSNPDPTRSDVLVAQIDITEQIGARDEVERMRQELAHASRISLLGQLTASIVHEVSQPITAISNHAAAAERLARSPEPPTLKLASVLSLIGKHASRVGEIIQRLRAVAANREVPMARLSLHEIASETCLLLRQELNEKSVQVFLDRALAIPAVRGDRIQLQQVLSNLMMNAIQAMEGIPPGDRRMDLRFRSEGRTVRVEVCDSGSGLSKQFLASPFQIFRTSKRDGLGIGLTICRSIAEAHGGSLELRDRSDARGAISVLTLPVAE